MGVHYKLNLIDTKGYNVKEAVAEIQEKRANWENILVAMIDIGFIKSYEQLKEALYKLK